MLVDLTESEADAVIAAIQERLKNEPYIAPGISNGSEGTAVQVLEKALDKIDRALGSRGDQTTNAA